MGHQFIGYLILSIGIILSIAHSANSLYCVEREDGNPKLSCSDGSKPNTASKIYLRHDATDNLPFGDNLSVVQEK